MARTIRSPRSTEAPMDYEWTNRTPIKPSWSQHIVSDDQAAPRKRSHDQVNPPTSPLGQPRAPIFGSNQNVPFIFNQNATPRSPNPQPWQPPPLFSPEKAFPNTPEPNDIDMSELTPNKGDEQNKSDNGRTVATGGMRRVYNARQKSQSRQLAHRRREDFEDDDDLDSDDEREPVVQNTSNHYTLNMPAAPPPQSDMPYILLGNNLCEQSAVPAMAQQCENWKTCMNRDPAIVGRAKVGAEMIAEVVNGFIEPISWKALASFILSLSRKVADHTSRTGVHSDVAVISNARQHPTSSAPPPPHPIQAQPSLPYAPQFGPGSGFLTPAPTPSWGRTGSRIMTADDEGLQTPTRRRRRIEGGASLNVK
ncbi:hypothetical protein H0H93_005050 [Arthromyces matolae]|nr:hypothetical protein H0H93_005050 [Arthromyces matolae]